MTENQNEENLKGNEEIENNDSGTNKSQEKTESTESTNSSSKGIMDGPLGWIIGAIVAGFLYGAYQTLQDWFDSVDEPKQEQTIMNAQDEQMISIHVGALTITLPKTWQISSGSEANQVKTEMEKGVKQTIELYKTETEIEHGDFGMGEFKAIKIPNNSGWCILYVTNFPEQKDYYQTYLKENTKKT